MSPVRLLGSLLTSSRYRTCGHAARSASLLCHRLPLDRHRAMTATGTALCAAALVGVRGMSLYNFKTDDDGEKSIAARKPTCRHQEVLETENETLEEKAMKKRFEEWMLKYGRTYKDEEEKAMRYELFRTQFVDEHNARPGSTSTCETNDFADRTKKELRWTCGGACLPEDELARLRRRYQDRP